MLDPGELNRQIVGGNIRLLYVEADGDIDFYLGVQAATVAQVTGVGGSYPTGFVGGETLVLSVDGTAVVLAFTGAAQSLQQVINEINAAGALAGLSSFIAFADGGELKLRSPTSGSGSIVAVQSGSGRATLGLPVVTVVGQDPVPNTSPIKLRRLAELGSSQVSTLKAFGLFSVLASAVFVSNPDVLNPVRYKIITAGDFSVTEC